MASHMWYLIAANIIVVLHLLFVVFVVAGGFLVFKWRWILFLHIPAAVWGTLIEFQGWGCPLTPLEKYLRQAGGGTGYAGGFINHYIGPILYPAGLSSQMQTALGILLIVINVAIYGWLIARQAKSKKKSA